MGTILRPFVGGRSRWVVELTIAEPSGLPRPVLNYLSRFDKVIAAGLTRLTPCAYVFDTVRFVLLTPLELPRFVSPVYAAETA